MSQAGDVWQSHYKGKAFLSGIRYVARELFDHDTASFWHCDGGWSAPDIENTKRLDVKIDFLVVSILEQMCSADQECQRHDSGTIGYIKSSDALQYSNNFKTLTPLYQAILRFAEHHPIWNEPFRLIQRRYDAVVIGVRP